MSRIDRFRFRVVALAVTGLVCCASLHAVPLTGLEMWVRADAGAEVSAGTPATDGQAVNIWQDQTANNHDMTVTPSFVSGTPTAPTFKTNQINGKPAVEFASSSNSLQSNAPLISGPSSLNFTIITVAKIAGVGERVMGSNYGFFNTAMSIELAVINSSNVGTYFHAGESLFGNRDVAGQWLYIEFERRPGGTSQTRLLRVNNVLDTFYDEATTGSGQVNSGLNWTMGSNANYDTGYSLGLVAEQLVYLRSLDASEREQIRAYMLDKYAIYPEPSMAAVLLLGGAGMMLRRRK